MQVLPWLSLGLGVQQTLQSGQVMGQAIQAAQKPRLSEEQQGSLRRAGTSNIGANLAERGLLDSSLYSGGLANLERQIAEASTGTAGDVPSMLYQQALGLGQSGGQTIGNLAQLYYLQKLFPQGMSPFGTTSTSPTASPWSLFPQGLGVPSFLR